MKWLVNNADYIASNSLRYVKHAQLITIAKAVSSITCHPM